MAALPEQVSPAQVPEAVNPVPEVPAKPVFVTVIAVLLAIAFVPVQATVAWVAVLKELLNELSAITSLVAQTSEVNPHLFPASLQVPESNPVAA